MPLASGTRLGAYTIVRPLGSGGMGDVYVARDTKLNRDVAIKVLPPLFAAQPERVARFEREAQLLASLNHPHIAQIYGVEEVSEGRALVMELVPGRTLTAVLGAEGKLPFAEAIAIARQIADALEAAHEKGIIHRDLKPGNVMVTPEGQVKLLDFGLGKALEPESSSDPSTSPTMTAAATQVGVILGTAAYMAPEQAKGRAADRRSDLWAFGCVLYELLAGRRAFEGEDVTDTLASILKTDVDWTALPANLPMSVRRVLQRCLQKDRQLRLRDIGDVQLELSEPESAPAPIAPLALQRAPRRERLAWIGAITIASALVGALVWWLRAPPPARETRVDIVSPPTNDPYSFALSPDGRQIVFSALSGGKTQLWLRTLDSTAARPIPGTDSAVAPFWSPDGRSIAFFASSYLRRVDLAAGSTTTLAVAPVPRGGTWSASNVVLYAPNATSPLLRVPATGGEPQPVTSLDPGTTGHRFPQFLGDGRHFVFSAQGSTATQGVYLGSLDAPGVKKIAAADAAPVVFPPDWLLLINQGALVARRLDVAAGTLSGDPVGVADGVSFDPALFFAGVSAFRTGLAYRTGGGTRRQLRWFDRTGKNLGPLGAPDDSIVAPALSPDGRRAAIFRVVQGNPDIWIVDPIHTTRLTFDAGSDQYPVWSPDGAQILFRSNRHEGRFDLYRKASSGAGGEELFLQNPGTMGSAYDWSRDGRFILLSASHPKTGFDLWVLPTTGDRKPYPFLNGPYEERNAYFSPDGRWVAYQSTESGSVQVYVRPFPGPGGQWQVSTEGGIQPQWRPDGKALYFIAPDGKLMEAPLAVAGNSVQPGAPVALFQTHIVGGGADNYTREQYVVARDGRLLINSLLDESMAAPITLVQNWRGAR